MRKVILLMHVSLDGFVAGPAGELNWVRHDDAISNHVSAAFNSIDTAIYGRTTYEMMVGYWPTIPAKPDSTAWERHHAEWVENIQKIVFSTTLDSADWNNTTLLRGNLSNEIARLKQLPGKDLMIFGSPGLTHSFMQLGLIDEYLLNVNPVVLGAGIPLFMNLPGEIPLRLLETTTFPSGVVSLRYQAEATPQPNAGRAPE